MLGRDQTGKVGVTCLWHDGPCRRWQLREHVRGARVLFGNSAPGKRPLGHPDPLWHRRLLYPCTVIKLEPVASDLVQLICGMDSVAFCSRCAARRSRVAALAPLVLCSKSRAAIPPHRPPHSPPPPLLFWYELLSRDAKSCNPVKL